MDYLPLPVSENTDFYSDSLHHHVTIIYYRHILCQIHNFNWVPYDLGLNGQFAHAIGKLKQTSKRKYDYY